MIVIFGDSHVRALAHGYMRLSLDDRESIESRLGGVRFAMLGPAFSFAQPFFERTSEGVVFRDPMPQRFARAVGEAGAIIRPDDPREFIVSVGLQTSYIHQPGILQRWTNGAPEDGAAHVSRAAFGLAVLEYNRHALAFYAALRDMGVKVSALAAPPPSPSFGLIAAHGDRALALWRAHDETLARELARLGVPIEQPPAIAREADAPDGFLRPALRDTYAPATPHGNGWYGELFLREVFARRKISRLALSSAAAKAERARLDASETQLAWTRRLGFALANRRLDATEQFLAALEADPGERRNQYGLAWALERLGRPLDAEMKYRELVDNHANWAEAWMALGRVLFTRAKFAEAREAFERAGALGYAGRDRTLRLAAIDEKLKRLPEARQGLREALFAPGSGELDRVWLARFIEEPAEAGFHALRVEPEPDPYESAIAPPVEAAPYLVVLGRVELALGDAAEAERCFELAMRLEPNRPEWNAYLADIDVRRKRWASAARRYATVVEHAPKVAAYTKRLGLAYERMRKLSAAREVYLKGASEHPRDVEFIDALRRVTIPA